MRFAWVRPFGPRVPDLWKAQRWHLERLIWDADDPQIDAKFLDDIRYGRLGGPPIGVGIRRSWDWENHKYAEPVAYANKLSEDLTRLGFGSSTRPESCFVLGNREQPHDSDDQLKWLKTFRSLRPTRHMAWDLEGHQAGWFKDDMVEFLNTSPNLWTLAQNFQGDMYPQSERWVLDDLRDRGIARDRAKAVYDGARTIPQGWDGLIFDFIKLPDINSHDV